MRDGTRDRGRGPRRAGRPRRHALPAGRVPRTRPGGRSPSAAPTAGSTRRAARRRCARSAARGSARGGIIDRALAARRARRRRDVGALVGGVPGGRPAAADPVPRASLRALAAAAPPGAGRAGHRRRRWPASGASWPRSAWPTRSTSWCSATSAGRAAPQAAPARRSARALAAAAASTAARGGDDRRPAGQGRRGRRRPPGCGRSGCAPASTPRGPTTRHLVHAPCFATAVRLLPHLPAPPDPEPVPDAPAAGRRRRRRRPATCPLCRRRSRPADRRRVTGEAYRHTRRRWPG